MKYTLTYNGKSVTRHADTAEEAVEKLCDQYHWRCKLRLCDADTRGLEWAECDVDTEGGINWNMTIFAEKNENGDERKFKVLPECQDKWTAEPGDCIVTESEIRRLAAEWDVRVEDLMEQVEEA